MLKKIVKGLLLVAVVIIAFVSGTLMYAEKVKTEKAQKEQAYRDEVEAMYITDDLSTRQIVKMFMYYTNDLDDYDTYDNITISEDEKWYECYESIDGVDHLRMWVNKKYVDNYVNYKYQQELLTLADF
jgi:NADH:ubiquinone oxidoreductase subunit 5 (subunit L)/multisubunit Na+/H+ antiporter MnhA subunit